MGGFGAWFLGQKHLDMWAAIAPMSGKQQEAWLKRDTYSVKVLFSAVRLRN